MVLSIDFKAKHAGNNFKSGRAQGTGIGGGILEDFDICSLTWKQRLYGFLGCIVAAAIICGLAYVSVITHQVRSFIILYSLGNIVALCSTGFLVGPMTQLRSMFAKTRYIATSVYLLATVLTFVFAWKRKLLLALLCMVIQFFALIWYSLSYIPYARTVIRKMIGL